MIFPVSQRAFSCDFDGLMVESHANPDAALSDKDQQITPNELEEIVNTLSYPTQFCENKNFEISLDKLRSQIDCVDREILNALHFRMKVVEKIGHSKIQNNVTALQVGRMDELMRARTEMAQELGLSAKYIKEIYNLIHDESVKNQTDIMRKMK